MRTILGGEVFLWRPFQICVCYAGCTEKWLTIFFPVWVPLGLMLSFSCSVWRHVVLSRVLDEFGGGLEDGSFLWVRRCPLKACSFCYIMVSLKFEQRGMIGSSGGVSIFMEDFFCYYENWQMFFFFEDPSSNATKWLEEYTIGKQLHFGIFLRLGGCWGGPVPTKAS